MADLTITASEVIHGPGAQYLDVVAAEAIVAGQACYLMAGNKAALADADASLKASSAKGIANNSAAAGQWVRVQTTGKITLGAASGVTDGVSYVVSDTAGGVKPAEDLASGDYIVFLGVGAVDNVLALAISADGFQF